MMEHGYMNAKIDLQLKCINIESDERIIIIIIAAFFPNDQLLLEIANAIDTGTCRFHVQMNKATTVLCVERSSIKFPFN